MRSRALLFLLALATGGLTPPARLVAQPKQLPPNLVAPTDALSPADERKAFTLPAGFDAQLVASEPDIQKPMQMAWDAKGRLWVTTSYHYPFPAEKGKGTDKLFLLSDFDPATGKAKKVQVFASDLNIPIGVLPLPDCKTVIVSSVGEIRKYTDADGDGKADKSEVLFTGFGFDDTHGMTNSFTLMPDGWVYACHGFRNDSKVKGKDGHEVVMNSGNTFRFRPDGSRIEVYTRGQVNPFGMAVDPWFNLYTADCHSKPITQLIPGAYYDSFGKPDDGLGKGPVMFGYDPGGTGMCGLAWYDADQFPKEFNGRMFLGNVVTNRVHTAKIEWHGSTPKAVQQPDMIASTDRWFRPVDIKLGPDGALYVADFYNKIIGHYEVDLKHPGRDHDHGRIWRIVWKGAKDNAPPPKFAYSDLTAEKWQVIDELLGHPNLTVRLQATNQAIHRQEDMQARDDKSDLYNVHRMWVDEMRSWLYANGDLKRRAYESDHPLLASNQYRIQRAITEVLRQRKPGRDPINWKMPDLTKADPHVARAAVEMMAGSPKAEYVAPLVELLKKVPADDSHLKHAVRVALRNCLRDDEKAWPPLNDKTNPDAIYAEMALAIPSQKAAEYLSDVYKLGKLPTGVNTGVAAEHVARNGGRQTTARLYESLLRPGSDKDADTDGWLGFLRGTQARNEGLSTQQGLDIVRAMDSGIRWELRADPPFSPDAVRRLMGLTRVLSALPAVVSQWSAVEIPKELPARLTDLVKRGTTTDLRIAAAETLLRIDPDKGVTALRPIFADLTTPADLRDRLLVTFAASGNKEARLDARDALKDAPYRTAVAVGAALAGTQFGAEDLLAAVKMGKAPARLLQEKAILERLRAAGIPDLDKQVAALTKGLPALDARLADLIKKRAASFASAKPDKEAGAKLFAKHCAACHRIGDQGGKIAPQLDGIGIRGLERVLEDTLDPNRNVDQAFRARVITTKDEKTLTAMMLRVEGEVLVVADSEGKEIRIPTKDIATNRETMLSPMPANFGDIIPEAEFAHLVAYLLDQRAKDPPKKE